MTLFERAVSAKVAGLTVAANFWPWLLACFLLGLGAGAYPAYKITRMIFERATLRAENNLANFRADLATNAATGEATARTLLAEAFATSARRDAAIESQIDAGFSRLTAKFIADFNLLSGALNDPRFACLDEPLPAPALELLQRPGGTVPAGGGGSAEGSPASSGMPPAAGSGAPARD